MNRVTDTCIPEVKAVRTVEKILLNKWLDAEKSGDCKPPHEYLIEVIKSGELEFQGNPDDCWLIAANDMKIPIFNSIYYNEKKELKTKSLNLSKLNNLIYKIFYLKD